MGFNEVYKSLLERFPQIDVRALRAVAIEHRNDVDAAVTAVLEEIIPFFVEKSRSGTPSTWSTSIGEFSGDGSETQLMLPEKSHENQIRVSSSVYFPGEPIAVTDKYGEDAHCIEVSGDPETEEIISGDNCLESIIKISSDNAPDQVMGTLQHVDMGLDEKINLIEKTEEHFGNLGTDCGTPSDENDLGMASADGNNFFNRTASAASISPSEINIHLEEAPNMHESNLDNLGAGVSIDTASKMAAVSIIPSSEDISNPNATISQSNQIQAINVLGEVIAHARNKKNTLFSAMEAVISLMREVELKEEAAEKAKEDAAKGGVLILDKAEGLKQMLQHAKEANEMHAGEVYGEKAILATEQRELQTRVLSLLDEKDKALGVLDEMSQTLKERLAAAQNVTNSAEQEKLEKEEAAHKSFADLELVMRKVAQESKTLKQQAEDNSQLQEFLLDRGHIVDMIQGELAVICQDVRLLKEKFDSGVPFSKSLYSNCTSFILALSSTSFTTSIPEQVEPGANEDDPVTEKGRDHEPQVPEEEAPVDDCNALLDSGWDIFDKHEINA